MMKLLYFMVLWSFYSYGMSDGVCGTIGDDKIEAPNEVIQRLNGMDCPFERLPNCPYNCKSYYINIMVESLKKFIEELYHDNIIDLATMEFQLKSLQTERTAEIFKEILDHIQKLKDE